MDVRITKYDPRYRNEDGHYTRDEWTEVSNIGKVYLGKEVTERDYLRAEDAYWETARALLDDCSVDTMALTGLETFGISCDHLSGQLFQESREWRKIVGNNRLYCIKDIEKLFRLCMRNVIWCILLGPDVTFLTFGYHCYVFFGSNRPFSIPGNAERLGIFVEPCPTPQRGSEVSDVFVLDWESGPWFRKEKQGE